ncbi:MAG: DUF4380 domain-containing protein [candidate division KSB1 bacterium]|nr:DUF4380 domain-containing protein [candidate division KSB1 bacterium]
MTHCCSAKPTGPDPFLTHAEFAVLKQREDYLKMAGPPSPVSGIRLTKEISLADSQVTFIVSAENIRDTSVQWDLWMNTRLDGYASFYVPADSEHLDWVSMKADEHRDVMPYSIQDGYFTFHTSAPSEGKQQRVQKAFLTPREPFIAAFDKGQMLLIEFEPVPVHRMHPEHRLVEIYNQVRADEQNLLELEVHGAFQALQPGERMSLQETWTVSRAKAAQSRAQQLNRIQTAMGN